MIDPLAQQLVAQLLLDLHDSLDYTCSNGLLQSQGWTYIGDKPCVLSKLLPEVHSSASRGHVGIKAIARLIEHFFYWPMIRKDVISFIQSFSTYDIHKYEHVSSLGLHQPLPIPKAPWRDIAIDFVEGLPLADDKHTILWLLGVLASTLTLWPCLNPIPLRQWSRSSFLMYKSYMASLPLLSVIEV